VICQACGHGRRIGRLLEEGLDHAIVVDVHDPEPLDSERGISRQPIVTSRVARHAASASARNHLVDVISCEQHDESGSVRLDDIDVLIDGVGRAKIPVRSEMRWLAGRISKLSFRSGERSSSPSADVGSGCGPCIGRNRDAADSRVHRIGKGKIDDARFSAEIDRRFGAPVGKLQKPASAPARENEGKGVA